MDVNASGVINGVISLPDVSFVQNNLSELSDNLVDPTTLTAGSCIARTSGDSEGSFTTTGTDGLPQRPNDAVSSRFSALEVETLDDEENAAWQPGEPIIEPSGIYQLANGRIVMGQECP